MASRPEQPRPSNLRLVASLNSLRGFEQAAPSFKEFVKRSAPIAAYNKALPPLPMPEPPERTLSDVNAKYPTHLRHPSESALSWTHSPETLSQPDFVSHRAHPALRSKSPFSSSNPLIDKVYTKTRPEPASSMGNRGRRSAVGLFENGQCSPELLSPQTSPIQALISGLSAAQASAFIGSPASQQPPLSISLQHEESMTGIPRKHTVSQGLSISNRPTKTLVPFNKCSAESLLEMYHTGDDGKSPSSCEQSCKSPRQVAIVVDERSPKFQSTEVERSLQSRLRDCSHRLKGRASILDTSRPTGQVSSAQRGRPDTPSMPESRNDDSVMGGSSISSSRSQGALSKGRVSLGKQLSVIPENQTSVRQPLDQKRSLSDLVEKIKHQIDRVPTACATRIALAHTKHGRRRWDDSSSDESRHEPPWNKRFLTDITSKWQEQRSKKRRQRLKSRIRIVHDAHGIRLQRLGADLDEEGEGAVRMRGTGDGDGNARLQDGYATCVVNDDPSFPRSRMF